MGIIIYGAGTYGRLSKKILASKGKIVDMFVDRKLASTQIDGINTIDPEEIPYGCVETIYIAIKNDYRWVNDFLKSKQCKDIRSIVELLNLNLSELPNDLTEREKDAFAQRESYRVAVIMSSMDGIKFNHVEAVVTQRCTLRCKDCSSLMPYYKNPKDVDLEELYKWIKCLVENVDYIGELRVLGGEPFLNENIGTFLEEVVKFDKIGMLSIYTNGMKVPSDDVLHTIKFNNIRLHISDYGYGGNQRKRFIEILDRYGILYTLRKYDNWFMMGKLEPNDYSDEDLKKMFMHCASSSCPTVLNGKLYQCPRAAHAEAIGAVNCEDYEKAELKDKTDINTLFRLSERKAYITTCRYCLGTNAETVEAAKQA